MNQNDKYQLVERVVTEAVDTYVLTQPWYQRYANTVTTIVSGLVTFVFWVTTSGLHMPGWFTYVGGGVMFAASVLGVYKTKNGMSPSAAVAVKAMVEETTGRHRRLE